MPGLAQGLLANNSVSPDVEIEECKNDPVRTRLKLASDKKSPMSKESQHGEVEIRSSSKVTCTPQPILIEKQPHSKPMEPINDNFLAYEVAKLSNKLDNFEKTAKLQDKGQTEQRTLELEQKLTEITDRRLQYLEKLQQEQEQWKSQYLQTIQKLNAADPLRGYSQQMPTYPIAQPASIVSNAELQKPLLQTPLPRKDIPQPTSSAQLSNGQFLRDILDQYNASTPNMSQSARIGPVDVVPIKLSHHQDIAKDPLLNANLETIPSPIKPSSSQMIAKEIENDVERQKISEKFPASFSDYLPHSKASPVSRLCTKTVPPSSLVAEFRQKLRQLVETRTTLENNLQAVQRKPKLEDFAIATLADQLEKTDWSNVNDEKIEMYWIQKLVDEQIAVSSSNIQQEVASQLKMQSKPSAKANAGKYFKRTSKSKLKPLNNPNPMKKKPKQIKELPESDNDEDAVTHVYGKAEYHPHRSTVHQPFMHVSPIKSPRFRNKRAMQSVPVTRVKSEKSQTTSKLSSPTVLRSKYLAPTAISLRPPQIYENDPDPIVIPAAAPVKVVSKPSPKKLPVKPPLPEVQIVDEPDELPGNATSFASSVDDIPPNVTEKVQLKGEGGRRKPVSKETFPCVPSRPSPPKPKLDANEMQQISAEDKVKCWVEQEIMARILGELHPASVNQETQTLNMQNDSVKRIIEDELRRQIHQRLTKPKPKESIPEEPVVVPIEINTPLSTPQGTPPPSVSERFPVRHYSTKTPSLTPQSSVVESELSISEKTPPPPRVATPPAEEIEVTIVATPLATPVPSSPEISCIDVSVTESVEESVASVHISLPDPWEGKNPEEDTHLTRQQGVKQHQTAPEPDPTELVVRPITPRPSPRKIVYSSTSESSSSEDSFKTEDKTISEGQLLIEHGEMIPKKRQPFQIPDDLDKYIKENTLADAADFDPISEGEFRPSLRPLVPKKSANYVADDPTGIYSRPRKPLNTSSDREDISVGEVPGKREKFRKWKSSRQSSKATSPPHPKTSNDQHPSDLNSTSIDSSSISEEIAPPPNVIMVTSATPRVVKSESNQNVNLDGSQQDVFMKDSLDDPLPRARNQMTLTLPSYDALSGASDTEEISVQDL